MAFPPPPRLPSLNNTPSYDRNDLQAALDRNVRVVRGQPRPGQAAVWAVSYLAVELGLPILVGDPRDPTETTRIFINGARDAVERVGGGGPCTPSTPLTPASLV